MPLGSHGNETKHDGGFGVGPFDPAAGEPTMESATTDGSEETLFDDEEVRDYDLGEGD